MLERMTQAEDLGYDDSYFPQMDDAERDPHISVDDPSEYILSHSPPSPIARMSGMGEDPDGVENRLDVEREREREREDGETRLEDIQERLDSGEITMSIPAQRGRVRIADEPSTIQLGTRLSPEHPGYLEHIPATALSPDDLPSHPEHHTTEQLDSQLERILGHTPHLSRSISQPIPAHYAAPPTSSSVPPRYPLAHTRSQPAVMRAKRRKSHSTTNQVAEAVFFSYGVSVFFGFQEDEEKAVMEDIDEAGGWIRGMEEEDWEVEEFHYVVSLPDGPWMIALAAEVTLM